MTLLRLARVVLNVGDLRRAVAFYCAALGFATVGEDDLVEGEARSVVLRLGAQELELVAWRQPGAAYPVASTAADLWFQHCAIVTNDIAAAYQRLQRYDAAPITRGGPQLLPPATGSVTAYKFRDPDGHPLELIHFPHGSGDPVWQVAASGPTIGIDHSAVSVGEVDRSVAFYRGLGLDLAARQVNSGPEQDRLDGLAAVTVDVVALLPLAATPHVELLCYRTPLGREAFPSPCGRDIADTKLIFAVDDLGALMSKSEPGVARLRDPDGHAIILTESP